MDTFDNGKKAGILKGVGTLLKPTNLAKTVATQIPFVSAAVEMANQLAGEEVGERLDRVESEVESLAKLRKLEAMVPKVPAPLHDWSIPVSEYLQRTIDLAI